MYVDTLVFYISNINIKIGGGNFLFPKYTVAFIDFVFRV